MVSAAQIIEHPRDVTEALNLAGPPDAPEMESARALLGRARGGKLRPPEIVKGLLHQRCKMLLAGTSKSMKSWALLDLALRVAGGQPWWGFETTPGRVLLVDFELPDWSLAERLASLEFVKENAFDPVAFDRLTVWNQRGHAGDITFILPKLSEEIADGGYSLVILDPIYKLLGNRDENAAGDMADLFNQLEGLAVASGAALVLSHHFAKGNAAGKAAADRTSGSGVFSRDPDAIVALTPHEEADAYAVECITRHHARPKPFGVRWTFPLLVPDPDLDPNVIKGLLEAGKLSGKDVADTLGARIETRAALTKELVAKFGLPKGECQAAIRNAEKAGTIEDASGMMRKKENFS